jgi:predicted RNA-binding protein with PIN domain
VLAAAADALGALEEDVIPGPLRPFARFTPARRARHAGPALATALESNDAFRERVADFAAERSVELAEAVRESRPPAAADPVDVAVLAYLIRPPGWESAVERATDVTRQADRSVEREEHARAVAELREQLDASRAAAKGESERHRNELAELHDQLRAAERKIRDQGQLVKRAERAAREAAEELVAERERAGVAASAYEAEQRRIRQRLADAETAAETARRAAREGRNVDDTRLWLLIDTVVNAAQGLRRELALSPTEERPADAVAAATPEIAAGTGPIEDPNRLDQLLALPRAHLIIDGYNVTKTGFGDLPLEAQRTRLVNRMGGIAAQSGAEITVVFDGTERLTVAPPAPRGVRVLFSEAGEIADELIRRLVRAEPPGRPLVVVSSDREVADGVRRYGAYAVPSAVLLARLGRG